jgi:hypothetical protein
MALLGDGWGLEDAESVESDDMPPPVRRAQPALYRLAKRVD